MNEKKLKIAFIGTLVGAFVLIVAMVLVWKFRFYDPLLSDLDRTTTEFNTQDALAKKLDASLKGALLAEQRLDLAAGELDYFRTRFRSLPMDLTESPVIGQGPRNATFVRYLEEYSTGFGVAAVRQLKRAADESGVVINSKIAVQKPPQNPEEVTAPTSGLLKPATEALAVTVTGSFDNVLRFFQIINTSEILMVIGNVKLDSDQPGNGANGASGATDVGTAPATGGAAPTIRSTRAAITASFTITPYLLVSGASRQQAAIPGIENARAGATAAAATTPAGGAGGVDEEGNPTGAPVTAPVTAPAAP